MRVEYTTRGGSYKKAAQDIARSPVPLDGDKFTGAASAKSSHKKCTPPVKVPRLRVPVKALPGAGAVVYLPGLHAQGAARSKPRFLSGLRVSGHLTSVAKPVAGRHFRRSREHGEK